ncbi:pentapeptide repeat-containing protein [Rothia aeria]
MIFLPVIFFQEKTAEQLLAQSNLRLALLYTTGGVIAALGLLETYRKNTNDRAKANADIKAALKNQEHQAEVLKEQIRQFDENAFKERKAERRERYTEAVEQLGSKEAPVRIGGVYTLIGLVDEWLEEKNLEYSERLKEGQVIINNLCAYIRSPFTLASYYDELSEDNPSSEGIYKDNQQKFYSDKAEFKSEADVRLSIIKEIHNRLQSPDKNTPGAWSDFEYDFSGSTFFYPIDLTNSYYTKPVNFSGSTYQDEVRFRGSTYQRSANFSGSTYQGGADFSGSIYTEEAHFYHSSYKGGANFSASSYKSWSDFSDSSYKGGTRFYHSSYKDGASFHSSTYQNEVYFSDSIYQDEVYFHSSIYQGGATFMSSTYQSGADFSGSTYQSWADFRSSAYQDHVNFSGSTYEKYAIFSTSESPSTYQGLAVFSNSTYNSWAIFSGSTYQDQANFSGSTYQDETNFSGSIFYQEIYFGEDGDNGSFSRFIGCTPQFYDETNHKNTLFGSPDNDFTVDAKEGYSINLNSEGLPLDCKFLTSEQKEYLEHKFQEIEKINNKLLEVEDFKEKAELSKKLQALNKELHKWREEATTVKVEDGAIENMES